MTETWEGYVTEDNPTDATDAPKILSLAEIVAADDLPTKAVFIPQWNGWVKVKGLSRKDTRRAYADSIDARTGLTDTDEVAKRMVCWGSVEPKITFGSYDELAKKAAGAVQIIVDAVIDLSGMAPDSLQRARDAFRR